MSEGWINFISYIVGPFVGGALGGSILPLYLWLGGKIDNRRWRKRFEAAAHNLSDGAM